MWLVAGLALLAAANEAWLHVATPFRQDRHPREFVPGVGLALAPDAEVRRTNMLDFWTTSRTNSLGFLDREPPSADSAAAGCHVVFVGDSFVEAAEVAISDKVQVRLQDLAAERLPHLNVAASGYGVWATGQIAQLPYYDKWIRQRSPKLVALVVANNDFVDNAGFSLTGRGFDLEHPPVLAAVQETDGSIALRAPDPDYQMFRTRSPVSLRRRISNRVERSWRVQMLQLGRIRRALSEDSPWENAGNLVRTEFTAFALGQWQRRTSRDGVGLVALTTYTLGTRGDPLFDGFSRLADSLGVPVIDQAGFILRHGAELADARWRHDYHWSPQGHEWAARATLDWLEKNQSVCNE